jgi:hypothetical protein
LHRNKAKADREEEDGEEEHLADPKKNPRANQKHP